MIQIFHNPRCSKSRECLLFLEHSGKKFETIEYLKHTPTYEELKALVQKLGIKPIALVRQKEDLWISKYKGKKMAPAQILRVLAKNPILIQRPIVINGDKAVIARPLEKANEIL